MEASGGAEPRRKEQGYKGLVLAWDDEARYRLSFDKRYWLMVGQEGAAAIAFSLADLSHELPESGAYSVEIEVEGASGLSARLPLERFGTLKSPPRVTLYDPPVFGKAVMNGKFKADVEPVFETFIVPLDAFEEERPGLAKDGIRSVTLHISGGPGKLMMDDFGFYPDRR